jgi:hypothetical protein
MNDDWNSESCMFEFEEKLRYQPTAASVSQSEFGKRLESARKRKCMLSQIAAKK